MLYLLLYEHWESINGIIKYQQQEQHPIRKERVGWT